MPPSLRDWLPADHLAWFVIETVEQLDLSAFYAAYRADGHGRAAYDPAVIVSLMLFAYCTGERSSRGKIAAPRSRGPIWPGTLSSRAY